MVWRFDGLYQLAHSNPNGTNFIWPRSARPIVQIHQVPRAGQFCSSDSAFEPSEGYLVTSELVHLLQLASRLIPHANRREAVHFGVVTIQKPHVYDLGLFNVERLDSGWEFVVASG